MLDVVVAGVSCEGNVLADVVSHEAYWCVLGSDLRFSCKSEVVLVPEASSVQVAPRSHYAVCPHLVSGFYRIDRGNSLHRLKRTIRFLYIT